ncbi:MAG: hypothetical protein HDR88_08235 [Bacteroides sp.]|nr:hypothetical protein [Bacteroides sp.]
MKLKIYSLIAMMLSSVTCMWSDLHEASARELKKPTVNLISGHTRTQEPVVVSTKPFKAIRRIPKISMPSRVNASGSSIMAMRLAPQPAALIEFNYDGKETMQWEGSQYWFPTTGFIYDGKIYGISSLYMYGTIYVSRMDYDIATGEIVYMEDMDQNPAHAAITAVYDPQLNEAYAYTYTEELDGYMFNKFDPVTFTFTPLNTDVAQNDICLAMTYDEKKDAVVGLTTDSRLVMLDTKTGTGKTLCRLPVSLAFSNTSMVYSPIDDAYVCQVIEATAESSILRIDANSYSVERTHSWSEEELRQYMIMFTPDEVYTFDTPAAPSLKSVDVEGPALSGSITFDMPSSAVDGSSLTGSLDLYVKIDGEDYVKKENLQPGSAVEISLDNMQEGLRIITARVAAGEKEGPVLKFRKYFGYDTPAVPANLRLEGNVAKWDAVTIGAEGGYVDNLRYEVWLNGEQYGETSDTYMELELPEEFSFNEIEVYAISHDKRSEAATSGVTPGGVLSLGTTIHPEENEWAAFTVIDGDNDGNTWGYDDWYGIFYRFEETTPSMVDEWVITPAYKITDAGMRHILSFNAEVDSEHSPRIEILMGSAPTKKSMTSIGVMTLKEGFYDIVNCYMNPISEGPCYIALRLLDAASIDIYDIILDSTGTPVTAPDNVTDIVVTPDAMGLEKAEVAFTLPSTTIAGTPLDGPVEVSVSSDKETVEAVGQPGERISVTLRVPEGMTRVALQTKEGTKIYSDEFYAGIDTAVAPDEVDYVLSEDNMEVTITWTAPTAGVHGGYIDPESLYYEVSIFSDEEGWLMLDDEVEVTTFTYRLADGAPQRAWYYSITPCNSSGPSEESINVPVAMGTPYSLPMNDYMTMGGKYEPLMSNGGDEYQAGWTYSYPEWYEEDASEIGDFIVIGVNGNGYPTKGSMILPKFNPNYGERIMAYFKFFFGDKTPDVILYGLSSKGDKTPVLDIKAKEMPKGYQTVVAVLPEGFNECSWAQIAIEPQYDGTDQCLIFASYSIFGAYSNDGAVKNVDGSRSLYLGEDSIFEVTLSNNGYEDLELPDCVAQISLEGKVIAEGVLMSEPEKIILSPSESASVGFKFNIDNPNYIGVADLIARIITPDKNPANDEMKASISISAGNRPVVTDLNAEKTENGNILLSWSKPMVEDNAEGFENCDPFLITPTLGEFTNIDGDEEYTIGYCFPYHTPENNPTGWIIWDRSTVQNAPYNNTYLPFSGERMAVAVSPDFSVTADDWLISPRVAGGSEISFMMAAAMAGVYEELQVMVSADGNSREDFTLLEKIGYASEDWTSYSVTLPDNAKYFALRYTTTDGCCLFLDDITYTPALANAVYTGYDIVRNGAVIAENVAPNCTYTDEENNAASDIYRVRPVYILDGNTERGLLSNEASAALSSISGVDSSDIKVFATEGQVVILNAMGKHIELLTPDGMVITGTQCDTDELSLPVSPGIILVRVDGKIWKVMVK